MAGYEPTTDPDATFEVVDEDGSPVPFVQGIAYAGRSILAVGSSWYDGTLRLPAADSYQFWAPGYAPTLAQAGGTIVLEPGDDVPPPPFLSFREPVPMPCDDIVWQAKQVVLDEAVGLMDLCGGGEPVLEVQSDGDIFLSTTIFLGTVPPIWKSEDGGASFSLFRAAGTGVLREATGTEVDMATDAAGNLYILDEQFATNWFTSSDDADVHRWSHPFPMAPKTHDRPWVVAGEADEVVIVYSDQHLRPRTSYQFRSMDGGLTFTPQPEHEFPCAQMLGQGPDPDHLMLAGVLGCSGDAQALDFDQLFFRESRDFGQTWSPVETAPLPPTPPGGATDRGMWVILNPVADEAGNTYIAYTHTTDPEATAIDIHLVRRDPGGTWHGPWPIGAPGTNVLPWLAAGKPGHLALSWYHTDRAARAEAQEGGEWHILTAYSVDADRADGDPPHFLSARADERPVYPGPGMFVTDAGLSRDDPAFLADFTAVEMLPDGSLGVAYSRTDDGDHYHSTPHFVRTERMDLFSLFPNGPRIN